ncbi:3-oxoacyl-[acyl-carrier protein] reductase [Rhizobium leguminosarum]|uniref:3-oxoacyl-[acyl-carrier protein] reductase n=1 Tax=Rhizobium leguminosarum TaxID=384 RepID=A0AAE2MLP8_RHILE|nr:MULTISPECIES: SDR family oxidoreductase [Rhizobium]MBB4291425.1 3-oxoacyl-[acyl-carrier protein] reductase [Rhizobium leguminosarum]MBB4296121.1 3-oxoacyl-[acyl-carrier protein] reductase [Rhizobium leguminosarum]MBB4308620.1 3-oxoacyl-[acyl-carrier protein] reductase [Rhizobium leguminosarum]MBB4416455.1 3-oxoacyl-[acyl-carrier protein] reductase [Rhizobium leguminosarum]MBB4430578.1 3-oxoacyl-[acyl-carrier protein] reductase [Rhizobium esperanzae]
MVQDHLPLAGKVALVTGGSRGIGAAIVRRLARDGADVAFSYSSSKDSALRVVSDVEAMGRRATALKADQGNVGEVAELVKKAHAWQGKLDLLINSAGVFVTGVVGDPNADIAAFDRQLDINLKGVVAAVRAAVPLISDGGRIVSIGTAGANTRGAFPGISDYVASKAAVAAYSRVWARDLGGRNITVNTVQPGPINTGMAPTEGEVADVLKSMSAIGRYGEPEEVAAAVAYLVGPEAGYITGSTLTIDGGLSI